MPWIGYFNKIMRSDRFVFLNDVQFERGKTFTSRTKILQQGEPAWLSVPVTGRGDLMKINEIQVESPFLWKKKHLKTLELNYKKTPFFHDVFPLLESVYHSESMFLQDYNRSFITEVSHFLGFSCSFINSDSLSDSSHGGTDKIISILKQVNAEEYISGSGSGSKKYISETMLKQHNIRLTWQEYTAKPYRQLNAKSFHENLSIVDLLFHKGKESVEYL
jgi:hypothetical protein